MLISKWMTKDPISVLPSTPLSKCQKLMKLRGIHRLPVVDDDNKVVGIVSDRDVKSNLPSKATTLSVHELQYLLAEVQTKEFMTPSPVTVRETETVSKAALLMLDGKFGGLPVVDDEGHLTGIITDQDVFKVFATLAGARVPGIELTLEVSTGEGALKSVFEVLRQQGARVVSLMTQFGEGETRQVYIRLQQPESEERARAIRSALEAQWKLLEWTEVQG